MPPLIPDAPWWANLVLLLAVLVLVPWLTNRGTKKKLNAMAEDISVSRGQVENEHRDSAFPNLRDEITAIRENLGGMHSDIRDLRFDVTGIRTDARRDRREIGQVRSDLAEAKRILEEHLQK